MRLDRSPLDIALRRADGPKTGEGAAVEFGGWGRAPPIPEEERLGEDKNKEEVEAKELAAKAMDELLRRNRKEDRPPPPLPPPEMLPLLLFEF